MSTEKSQIIDRDSLRKYRTEIPNLIDDLKLDPYAFRVYVHLKRIAGAYHGVVDVSTRDIAEHCQISINATHGAKKTLAEKNLIKVTKRANPLPDIIEVVDIWEDNFAHFKTSKQENETVLTENTPSLTVPVKNSTVPVKNSTVPVKNSTVPVKNSKPSQITENKELTYPLKNSYKEQEKELRKELVNQRGEIAHTRDAHHESIAVSDSSTSPEPEQEVKQPLTVKSEPQTETALAVVPANKIASPRPPTPHQALCESFGALMNLDLEVYGWGRLTREISAYLKQGTTPAQVEKFARWWFANDFRGQKGEYPSSIAIISRCWKTAQEWVETDNLPQLNAPSQTALAIQQSQLQAVTQPKQANFIPTKGTQTQGWISDAFNLVKQVQAQKQQEAIDIKGDK